MADVPVTIEFEGEGSDAIRETKAVTQELNKTNKQQEKSISLTNLLVFARKRLLGVSAALALAGVGKRLLADASAVDSFSQAVEVSSSKIQAWSKAADKTEISMESIREVLLNLVREQGNDSSVFRKIGLDLEEVRRANPEQLFEMINKKIAGGKMSAQETSAAIEVMGTKGEEVFLAMSNGFSRFAEQAKTDGRIISEEALDPMNEATSRLALAFDRVVESVKGGVTPALEASARVLTPLLDAVSQTVTGARTLGKVAFDASKLALGLTLPGADTGKLAGDLTDSAKSAGNNIQKNLMEVEGDLSATRTDKSAASRSDLARQLGRANRLDELADQLGGRKAVDGFARAGLFVTPGASVAQTAQQRQISILRRVAQNTRDIVKAVEKN